MGFPHISPLTPSPGCLIINTRVLPDHRPTSSAKLSELDIQIACHRGIEHFEPYLYSYQFTLPYLVRVVGARNLTPRGPRGPNSDLLCPHVGEISLDPCHCSVCSSEASPLGNARTQTTWRISGPRSSDFRLSQEVAFWDL
jgi:hypothetical protein